MSCWAYAVIKMRFKNTVVVRILKMEKLVRDQIPAFLKAKGIVVDARVMESQEFISKLKGKLLEEANEVLETHNSAELCEELADVRGAIPSKQKY